MIFHDIKQNTDEWFELRKGRATSSNFSKIMANEGKAFGKPALEYAVRLAYEQKYDELAPQENYTNKWMLEGHLYEPVARQIYEEKTFEIVLNGGFYEHETMLVGGSPDGRLLDGSQTNGIEIKSVKYTTQRNTIKRDDADPTYKWQYQGNIWLGEMEYLDFISYSHILKAPNNHFIKRVYRDNEMIERLISRLHEFQELINKQKQYI